MAQHDYIIANQSGAAFRSDLNNGLAAIVSQNSGAAQPSTTYAYQWWADTTTGLLKIRNAANNAWITVGTLASTNLGLLSSGNIVNADIDASAAISLSKLATGALPTAITVASANIVDGSIVNEDISASAGIVDTKLATISTASKVSNSATTATNANTPSAIVARDASGNFSAGTITAALTGAASSNLLKAGDTMTGDITFATAQPRVARAWVNFNGTGSVAIRSSFNVSSVTDLGTGDYRVNFTTAMPDANYAVTTSATDFGWVAPNTYATGSVKLETTSESGGNFPLTDNSIVCIAVFR